MSSPSIDQSVDAHYGRSDLLAIIMAGLQAAGKDPVHLSVDDLAPVDPFHTRGREATLELARMAGIEKGMSVLDVGGGIGGAARMLASIFDCHVTVLDLTEDYVRTGELLTRATNLSDRITFHHGSALDMPFPDGSFDMVWTQHSSMNIADKERLYAEINRVLRTGGQLVMHEIMMGTASPIYFPVPWARTAETSHLRRPEAVRELIKNIGFKEIAWVDQSAQALEWFKARAAAGGAPTTLPPLGLNLLLGSDFVAAFGNQVRNLAEDRVAIIQAVFERL